MESEIPENISFRKGFLYGVLFFSFAGASLAAYATYLTFKLSVSGIIDPGGCSFNDWLSCDTVLSTRSATLRFFLLLLKSLKMSFKNIAGFELDYLKSIFSKKKSDTALSHPARFGIIFIWLFAMGYLGLKYYENTVVVLSESKVKLILQEHFKQDPVNINPEGSPVTGNPGSKIKIIEFSDFECPACKLLSSNMNTILLESKNDVSFYFMNYPLDKSINANIKNELHKNAGLAAICGVCAQEQGKFWDYQKELFENQTKINKDFLIELADQQGLDKNKFNSCMDSEAAKQKVIRDIETGHEINITGTPVLFINGRKVKYWNSPAVLNAIIEEELKK